MKKLILSIFALTICAGCHGQVPPTNHTVVLDWTAANGCTTAAPCSYIISRATLAIGTTQCPAPNIATPNYTPLNASLPVSGTTYTDSTASGTLDCYIAQTQQGSAVSVPSNVVGPLTVPANPSAPTLGTPTLADLKTLWTPQLNVSINSPQYLHIAGK